MDHVPVGYFSRTHGLDGWLFLREESGRLSDSASVIFVETKSGIAPYFVRGIQDTAKGLRIALEDVPDVVSAKALVGRKVHAKPEDVEQFEKEHAYVGFSISDPANGLIGTISEIQENGAYLLATVLYQGRDVVLPLAEELVDSVDEKKKVIVYRVPPGLLDM